MASNETHQAIEDQTVMIFGASGDLTARKLIPALYRLWHEGYLGDKNRIIGVARKAIELDQFRDTMRDAVKQSEGGDPDGWDEFAQLLRYYSIDLKGKDEFQQLREAVKNEEQEAGLSGNRIVYLSIPPRLFLPSVQGLAEADMIPRGPDAERLKVVFEKPFGHDLDSAQELSESLSRLLDEQQIYRIDHYLGKETVQNILLFRFGNAIFEPLFNRTHVDHVQITVAETVGMERGRGGYYDQAGALRDVLQNHGLQLLCLVAMEPPPFFRADQIRDEKLKVLHSLSAGGERLADWAIAGQYAAAAVDGERVPAYVDEDKVDPSSTTETYVAMKALIDNWRWAGVPFYLRTGKRLPERVTEIAIQFKLPPLTLFSTVECEGDMCDLVTTQPNTLVFRIQPHEEISISFSTKRPGMQYQVQPVEMDFEYGKEFEGQLPEAYERLLLDVMRGDSTLFMRSDELEAAWRFVTPVLEAWQQPEHRPELYHAGTWGPREADDLLRRDGHCWRTPAVEEDQPKS